MNERQITDFLHTKAAVVVVAILMGAAYWLWGTQEDNVGALSVVAAYMSNIGLAVLALYIDRTFNVLRSMTALVATMFLVFGIGNPIASAQFGGGVILVLLMLLATLLLFSIYSNPNMRERVFLLFFLFSLASFRWISFVFFVPLLFVGLAQMKIFTLRTFVAAMLGLVTPPWILVGFGLISISDLTMMVKEAVWWHFDGGAELLQPIVATCITVFVGLFFFATNVLKILSYNSQVRSYNGFLTVVFLYTALLSLLNFANFMFYVPMLNLTVAYQVAHFFSTRRQLRSYVPILLIILLYIGLYGWELLTAM